MLLQIVKQPILSLPPRGAINFHPALFQDHRGTFTSFWALLRKKQKSGATVHFMTEKPDEGRVILQKNFFIHPSDTIHCVNLKSSRLGANLLVKALVKLKKQRTKYMLFQKIGRLFTTPKKKDVDRFYREGHRIIKWKDFFRI